MTINTHGDSTLRRLYLQLKERGLAPDREQKILDELNGDLAHSTAPEDIIAGGPGRPSDSLYAYHDLFALNNSSPPGISFEACLRSIDELLERDKLREKDGFPKKIRMGRLVKPGRGERIRSLSFPPRWRKNSSMTRVSGPRRGILPVDPEMVKREK